MRDELVFWVRQMIEPRPDKSKNLLSVILTEVFSYNHLAELISSGQLSNPRRIVILSYALCGFTHIAAMAIFIGGNVIETRSILSSHYVQKLLTFQAEANIVLRVPKIRLISGSLEVSSPGHRFSVEAPT